MRLRAPNPDDAPAVLAVLVARDLVDLGVPEYTLGDLLDEWRSSDVDLATDARVTEADDGRIVAYASVQRRGSFAVVAPDHEDRGIGALLLRWTERRERERGNDRHRQWIAASNTGAKELLVGAGYELVRSYWRMARPLDDQLPAPGPLAEGLQLRPIDVERDAVALHALDAASFAASPDYIPEPLTAFREEHLQAHDFDPALSRVIVAEDRIVGFLFSRRWPGEVGFVDLLGVDPDHQGRGLGMLLLLTAVVAYAADGLGEAQLGVASDNARGLRLYERVGMTARFQFDVYERPL
jgi:mycothiol synthase